MTADARRQMTRQATADAVGVHERASATPSHVTARHAAEPAGKPAPRAPASPELPAHLDLRAHQEWFSAAVTTPESEPAPVDEATAPRLVTSSRTMTSLERLEVYRRGYHARLVECLADDYPVLAHLLGEEAFDALCRAYIARFPSRAPNLNAYGRHMAELCRAEPLADPAFAADLATLEWAIVTAIHAPTAPLLSPEDLAKVPAERWPQARLEPNPSLRVLHLSHPVNAYFQAFRTGAPVPVADARGEIAVAVYRTGKSLWRMELAPAMVVLVESLAARKTLLASLDAVEPLLDVQDEAAAGQLVMSWFQNSISSGMFSGVSLG